MKPLTLFLLLTFGLFIVGFALVGLLISIGGPNFLLVAVQIAIAWTPTLALAILHRKGDPGPAFRHKGAGCVAPPGQEVRPRGAALVPTICRCAQTFCQGTDQACDHKSISVFWIASCRTRRRTDRRFVCSINGNEPRLQLPR